MFSPISRKFFVQILAALILTLSAGCAATPFSEKYQPGASEVTLWGNEAIPLEPQWRYIGTQQVTVRGELRDTSLTPIDVVQTMLFIREDADSPPILLLSRVIKTNQMETFVFLGGDKATLGDRIYRESLFSVSADTPDPEYRKYFDALRVAGIAVAPSYRVRVLDRLPVDTVLVRTMELTPDERHVASTLPPYAKLYPQDRKEVFLRTFR